MVARQTLTLFVWVQILVPQPIFLKRRTNTRKQGDCPLFVFAIIACLKMHLCILSATDFSSLSSKSATCFFTVKVVYFFVFLNNYSWKREAFMQRLCLRNSDDLQRFLLPP